MFPATTIVYYVLQLLGSVMLTVLTVTMFWPNGPSRHLTIPNQNMVWIIQGVLSSLLLFRSNPSSVDVNHTLCKVQSAIVFGAAPALSAAAFAVVARLWFLTFTVDQSRSLLLPNSRSVSVSLVALPYVVWFAVAMTAGITSGDDVRRLPQYCGSDKQTPSIVAGVVTAAFLVVASCFQVWALFIVWGRYRQTRRLGKQELGNIDVALFVRISAFAVLIIIAIVVSMVAVISSWYQLIPDLVIAGMGPIMFFIFGTQRDILEMWHLKPKQQISSRTRRSTPANTFISVHGGGRPALGSSGAPYGTDAWDVERDLAHQGINRPAIVVSGPLKSKGISADDLEAEDIEMNDSKLSARVENEDGPLPGNGTAVRTIRVWTYDDPPNDRHGPLELPAARDSLEKVP